ncbi:hypothetical protein PIB30_056771 [Stylosanthes scabra]|uniref:Secreted protein n=1 Tax=Stylosanthes scabra TaxID=79078 RepID=A0ABU6VHP2_9FABA|nr:hypothetical protein [Stylosanthes scabra]
MAYCFRTSSSALLMASEANAASQVCLSKSSLRAASNCWMVLFLWSISFSGVDRGLPVLSPSLSGISSIPCSDHRCLRFLLLVSRSVPTDDTNVKVESLTIVQRTSKRGRDTRFGTRRCAFGDKPYGVAESYSREGVIVEVNSSRSPE